MRWQSRTTAFGVCFTVGLLAALVYAAFLGLFRRQLPNQTTIRCATTDYFNRPEEVLADLQSPEVNVRRALFRRLFLRPGVTTTYYDYERDCNFPERADRARLVYVQLDDSPDAEALLTFVRLEHPVALVFKKEACGWQLAGTFSSWLRFEDYPYENWLSLPETIKPGVHELLVRDSNGDAASYVRQARLLRLDHGALKQIADINEETIEPLENYRGSDWSDARRRRINHYAFFNESTGKPARIESEVSEEVIKFTGAAPAYSYWLETDGSWHALQRNWSARPATHIKLLGVSKEQLVWNEPEGRFVKL